MLLPLLAFVLGSLLVTAAAYSLMARPSAAIDQRLRDVVAASGGDAPTADQRRQIAAFFQRLGERMPKSASELSKLQLRLVQAGYRRSDALTIFLGLRIAVALGVFLALATPIFMTPNVGLALVVLP